MYPSNPHALVNGNIFPGNPYALVTDGIVTDVVFMQDYTDEQIAETLTKYTFDSYYSCSELGRMVYVGWEEAEGLLLEPKPHESWIVNHELQMWDAPVPMPNTGQMYGWDENIKEWYLCPVQPGPKVMVFDPTSKESKELVNGN